MTKILVGVRGIEPPIPHPQRGVLPLYYTPTIRTLTEDG